MTESTGYSLEDFEQQGLKQAHNTEAIDPRAPFKHDRDRILYSSAFSALAGKTQVVPADELGGYHTRLTHSLKVAQVGRRMAEMLVLENGGNGPDPDLVESACLAHDIGHPPFGHAGETALRETYGELMNEYREPGDAEAGADGFEGNAQNFRILTYLSDRSHGGHRGLHLTRATLDATTKYPWRRALEKSDGDIDKTRKFGIYAEDEDTSTWLYGPSLPSGRPVEEQIMDWADDVTYACHDLEDFFRAGFIPLASIVAFPTVSGKLDLTQESEELSYFLNYVEGKWTVFDRQDAVDQLRIFSNYFRFFGPFRGSHRDRQALAATTRGLIRHMLTGIALEPTEAYDGHLTRYGAKFRVPEDRQRMCALLKELIWCYVIDRPELTGQQRGQKHMVSELLRWHSADPEHLLPADRLEDFQDHSNRVRAACDHVSSLTEKQATTLFRRMSGTDIGSITDVAY
ncbi:MULTISPECIES: dGTP triphosphohydrolase [unclassified Arthrobacter]|uniref:deoxyguanosinetriphosphate triphosphohydrolase family protein n=1 Tax=unclassified Arthrobacter TaxID=235627 RepID=UPI00254A2B8C|nr:dNTP triphosphohydrolase [Arthrobacter sp. efr-133-TYG-120]